MAYIGQGAGVGLAADATVTNLTVTGTVDLDATGNIDGPVTGANTAAAGTFTTLEATSLDNTPIGGTTPAAGSFTDMAFNSGYGSVATAYGCRAWVNFDGTGTVAIRESGNVSSITDNSTGNYTVNFTNAMPDANFAGFLTPGSVPAGNSTNNWYSISQTSSTYQIYTSYLPTPTAFDYDNIQVAIFR
jgi:hypothetical protein